MPATCTHCAAEATVGCVDCQDPLCADHTILSHPLITVRQLMTAILTTAMRAPGMLGELLFKELDQVNYCATCRETVSVQRQAEQLKLAGGMLLALVLVVGLPTFLMLS